MKKFLLLLLIPISGLSIEATAQGDLLLTPTRVVFEGNKQREEINLVNTGKDTATYSISFVEYTMKNDGSYALMGKSDSVKLSAEPYLRIFPRQITLAPGEPQVIMIQYRKKADMPIGEYRSHLYFRSEKDYTPLGSLSKDTTKLISVQLIPIYGISIPIIIRHGVLNVTTSLTNLTLETQSDLTQVLKLAINRAGNCSSYGDMIVDYINAQGKSHQIGKIVGVKVFTNLDQLNIAIKLSETKALDSNLGKLKVRYVTSSDAKYLVYAEKEVNLEELQRANLAITTAK